MAPRNIDAPTRVDLTYICSREREDRLDWLENQGRTPWGFPKVSRLLAGAAVGAALLCWAAFLACY